MSLSAEIERLIPRLRRFARASTADKAIADACVAQAIEDLIAENRAADNSTSLPEHVRVYRAVEKALEAQAGGSFEKQSWRALILVFVEEFSPFEAGWILGVDVQKVKQMVEGAEAQVRDVLSNECP